MTPTDRELLEGAARAAGMITYDPENGSMIWMVKDADIKDAARWNSRYAGKECGTLDDKGYRRILFRFEKGKTFKIRAHRLAWFITYGVLPSGEIDHINQDKLDNRIRNLRDVPKSVNQRNSRMNSNNTSGASGVTWHKQRRKWCAQASANGRHHHIGLFVDQADAVKAAREFRLANGFTENHGRAITRAAYAIDRQSGREG